MKQRIRWAALLLFILSSLLFSSPHTHSQRTTNIEQRVNSLLAQMTLAEKLGQLQQLDGEANGNFRPEHLELIRKGLLGSTLNVRGAQRTNQLQRVAMNESRLKIPVLFGFDAIHGYRTIFPIPLGEAASFDPSLAERSAGVAAQEANNVGVRWTFAPMVDIARDPRWGRITEGAGEDPYLGSVIATARVKGFQGKGLGNTDAVMACDQAIASDPTMADAYYIKASALFQASLEPGRDLAPTETRAAFSKYLELAPSGRYAQASREMLYKLDSPR